MIKKFKFHTTCTLGFFWICYVFVCFNKLSINFKRYICIYKRKINYEAFEQATLHQQVSCSTLFKRIYIKFWLYNSTNTKNKSIFNKAKNRVDSPYPTGSTPGICGANCKGLEHHFLVLVLEGLVGLHRTVQLPFFSITGRGIDLDYRDIEWFALEMNRDRSVVFETLSKYCISGSFVDYNGYSGSSRDSCPQQQI